VWDELEGYEQDEYRADAGAMLPIVQAHIDAAREQAEVERDFNGEAWDAEQNRSAALQEQLDAAREQVAAVEAVVAQAQHPALRCKTLAEDVELIWGGRTQAREACEQWKAERDAAVARAEAAEQAVARVRAEINRLANGGRR
jgi:hypothetical protein